MAATEEGLPPCVSVRLAFVQPQQGRASNTHSPLDPGATGAQEILDDGESGLVGNVINRLMKRAVTVKINDTVFPEIPKQLVEDLGPVGVGHGLVELAANFAGHRIQFVGAESRR